VADDLRDYFLKIDGIEGESQDKIHNNEVRLLDFGFVLSARADTSGHIVGKMVIENASFSASIDQSYPLLMKALTTNAKIQTVVLTCRKAGKTQEDFFKVTLTDVFMVDCRLDGSATVPTMAFKMGFKKIMFGYREQNDKGILGGELSQMIDIGATV
jgi:type VI secretion system secreted protein Hcp